MLSKMSDMNEKMKMYKVPEGYFDQLKIRLEEIPAPVEARNTVSLWTRVQPYAALAACFAMAFVAGTLILGRSSSVRSDELSIEDYYYADIIPVTDPYAIFEGYQYEGASDMESSEDDIIEYLISSGASADYIAYMINE